MEEVEAFEGLLNIKIITLNEDRSKYSNPKQRI